MTMGGNTLLEVKLERMDQTLLWLLKRVRTKLPKEPACRIKFILADGRCVGKQESKVPLLELLGLSEHAKQPVQEQVKKPVQYTRPVELYMRPGRTCEAASARSVSTPNPGT